MKIGNWVKCIKDTYDDVDDITIYREGWKYQITKDNIDFISNNKKFKLCETPPIEFSSQNMFDFLNYCRKSNFMMIGDFNSFIKNDFKTNISFNDMLNEWLLSKK